MLLKTTPKTEKVWTIQVEQRPQFLRDQVLQTGVEHFHTEDVLDRQRDDFHNRFGFTNTHHAVSFLPLICRSVLLRCFAFNFLNLFCC